MIIQSEMSYLIEDIETLAFNCFVGIFQCSVAAAVNALLWDPHQLIDPVRRHHERNLLLFLPRRQMQRPKLHTSGNHYRLFDKVFIDEVFLDNWVDCFQVCKERIQFGVDRLGCEILFAVVGEEAYCAFWSILEEPKCWLLDQLDNHHVLRFLFTCQDNHGLLLVIICFLLLLCFSCILIIFDQIFKVLVLLL